MLKSLPLIMSFVFAGLISCTTIDRGLVLKDVNLSLAGVRAGIIAIAGKPREIGGERREYFSQYFERKKDPNFNPNISKERLYARFEILGDQRPYDIRVTVYLERKVGNQYELVGEDLVMDKQIARELKEKLNQSQDGRNMIDDFKPF